MRLGEVKSGQVRSSQVRPGYPFSLVSGARSAEKILLLQPWRAQRGENFVFAPLARAARRKILQRWTRSPVFFGIRGAQRRENFAFAKTGARSAEKNFATLDWVTRFLRYLARTAWRKFCFCNPSIDNAKKKFDNARLGHLFSLVSGARSAEKYFATLDWVTQFLWYLARAARRKM